MIISKLKFEKIGAPTAANAFSLVLALFFSAFYSNAYAGASLAISPTRIIFEGRTRTTSVSLINNGGSAATFRISFERKRMTEQGDIKNIKKPKTGELFADQMIRFSPRQISLAPGQVQVVRLLLRKPPGLETGEYRSHMLFREIPPDRSSSINTKKSGKKKLSIQIIPVIGLSIPIIVRHGKTEASVKLTNLKLHRIKGKPGSAKLTLKAIRDGNQSVYGDFTIYHNPGNRKEKLVVSKSNGLAIYTPNKSRNLSFKVQTPKGVSLDQGNLEVVYQTQPDKGDKLIASANLPLN